MKIDWTIKIVDVIFVIMFLTLGYFAIEYDVKSHNEAIRKCEMWYNQTFNTTYIIDNSSGFQKPFTFINPSFEEMQNSNR